MAESVQLIEIKFEITTTQSQVLEIRKQWLIEQTAERI